MCKLNFVLLNMFLCFLRASGTVYTAIDIATGQEVHQPAKTAACLLCGSSLYSQSESWFLSSGGHQANEPAAAAQEGADHQ